MECRALPVLRRLVLAGVLASLLIADAFAQEDALRGAFVTGPATMNWRGVYGGGQWNYNNADNNFGNATGSLVSRVLRNTDVLDDISAWSLLQNSSTTGTGFGGFIGYNWQWDDFVAGLEANYNRTSLSRTAADQMTRSFIDNSQAPPDYTRTYTMTLNGNGYVKITDLGTFRARAGWAIGSFLPYGFVGLAVGRADVATSVAVSGTRQDCYEINDVPVCDPVQTLTPGSQTVAKNGRWVYGGSVGLGFDWALTQNLFVRGEWELTQINDIEGIDVRLNTGRVGLGLKF